MAPHNLAVTVEGLTKVYRIAKAREAHNTLASALIHKMRNPRSPKRESFYALNGVNMCVNRGEVVGIIGRNGAGKSTLLKTLSRITAPTEGKIDLYGRVGSLLEVGTGFHAELTGRENIYLNGAILGMRKTEIRRQFDAIVDFSGVGQFLDTPVKRYSSGMYVRLAFGVAAHLRSEIMIVDEVLSVGDSEFQQKCLGKMHDVSADGRTVLFVSHNMQAVANLCRRGIVLRKGKVVYDGEVKGAIDEYMSSYSTLDSEDAQLTPDQRPGSGEFRFVYVSPSREMFDPDEEKIIKFRVQRKREGQVFAFLTGRLINETGVIIGQFDSRLMDVRLNEGEALEGSLAIKTPWLKPGIYRMTLRICPVAGHVVIDDFEDACRFTVSPVLPYPGIGTNESIQYAAVLPDYNWHLVNSEIDVSSQMSVR